MYRYSQGRPFGATSTSTFLVVGTGWLAGEEWNVQPWIKKMNSFLQIQIYYYFMIYRGIVKG
jgi:hypothetical protein